MVIILNNGHGERKGQARTLQIICRKNPEAQEDIRSRDSTEMCLWLAVRNKNGFSAAGEMYCEQNIRLFVRSKVYVEGSY